MRRGLIDIANLEETDKREINEVYNVGLQEWCVLFPDLVLFVDQLHLHRLINFCRRAVTSKQAQERTNVNLRCAEANPKKKAKTKNKQYAASVDCFSFFHHTPCATVVVPAHGRIGGRQRG